MSNPHAVGFGCAECYQWIRLVSWLVGAEETQSLNVFNWESLCWSCHFLSSSRPKAVFLSSTKPESSRINSSYLQKSSRQLWRKALTSKYGTRYGTVVGCSFVVRDEGRILPWWCNVLLLAGKDLLTTVECGADIGNYTYKFNNKLPSYYWSTVINVNSWEDTWLGPRDISWWPKKDHALTTISCKSFAATSRILACQSWDDWKTHWNCNTPKTAKCNCLKRFSVCNHMVDLERNKFQKLQNVMM